MEAKEIKVETMNLKKETMMYYTFNNTTVKWVVSEITKKYKEEIIININANYFN